MIKVDCGGCDETATITDRPVTAQADQGEGDPRLNSGMAWCEHCQRWYHRVGCLSFHKAGVPFVNRRAERVERRRLAWLDRQDRRAAGRRVAA